MKNQIHFDKADPGRIPIGQLESNGFIDQGVLPGVFAPVIAPLHLVGPEESVNGGRTDGPELSGCPLRDLEMPSSQDSVQFDPNKRGQALAAGGIKELLEPKQSPMVLGPIAWNSFRSRRWFFEQQGVDLANDVFSVLSCVLTVLVQKQPLASSIGFHVLTQQHLEILFPGVHVHPFHVTQPP